MATRDVRIPADATNPTKDVLGNTLTNPGGLAHNNGGYGITQDPAGTTLLDQVTLYTDGTPFVKTYSGVDQLKAKYGSGPDVYWDGGNWIAEDDFGTTSVNTNHFGQYPPEGDWPNAGGHTFSVEHDSKWVADDGTINTLTFANFVAHHNFDQNMVLKWTEDCLVSDILTWPTAYEWIPLAYLQINHWDGTPCYADPLVPAEVTAPTGIGTDRDWADNGNGAVLFVEDL